MKFDYRGFFHIHSAFSHDGTTDIKDIIKSAQRCGADFIIITDHSNLKTKDEGFEGYHGDLLVIAGEEITPSYNHYLAVGIKKPIIAAADENPQNYIDSVNRENAAGFIAHPDHTGAKLFGVRSYAWRDWTVTGYDAVSIWDLMTDWQEKLASYPKAFLAFLFPALVLSGPKRETLERWDNYNLEKREPKLIAGYGEIDNHNSRKWVMGLPFRIFPFNFAFKTISTHILLKEELSKDVEQAKRQIINAVKSSQLYVAQEKWENAKGFEFYITDNLRTAYSGDSIHITNKPKITVKVSAQSLIKIIGNGKTVFSRQGLSAETEISESGVYRVEVYLKKFFRYRPWIFSNHIRVE